MTGSRGLSGARVMIVGDEAIKFAYERQDKVVQQGEWLQFNDASPHLPHVHAILKTGYAMEKLQPIPTGQVDVSRMCDALHDACWRWAPTVHVNTPETMLYVNKILESFAPDLVQPVLDRVAYIRKTEDCLTHGDPTAENVMLRGDDYVMIDPIPATCRVPDDKAKDIGKILQSAHGWEAMKGEEPASFTPDDVAKECSDLVFEVAQHWLVVHFVRTLPYAGEEVRNRVVAKLHELLGL